MNYFSEIRFKHPLFGKSNKIFKENYVRLSVTNEVQTITHGNENL